MERQQSEKMHRSAVICRCLSTSSVSEAKKLLLKYPGGRVDVQKNESVGIATVCLQRPDKKNAISGQILMELDAAADTLANWSSGKAFLLYGTNNFFCSGGDLAMSLGTATYDEGLLLAKFAQFVFGKLKNLPLVSAAFVEGAALGGGAEMSVAACDWRLMAPDAKIGFVHAKMGLSPGWGGTTALTELVGPSRALELTCSGRLLTSEEAKTIGLATDSVSDLDGAFKWLESRSAGPVEVIRACKEAILEGTLDAEAHRHATLWGGEAKMEALRKKIKHLKVT
ncbi:ethylmalonyl-CoA decarboxylase-like isoform X3 [Neocloeon triangulifer]|uniref:ethylmalonyl-CoA decarboxylase-like isoform X3 n=1 Tax=Neocloeon triangulifer TaxID=2078957 RepID=UPI00286F4A22|nr:ethylmalonyl-CoA decarboxylase-like isoform X3 [Neocloeon triangulifer]